MKEGDPLSCEYHMNRPRGNLLPRPAGKEYPNKVTKYTIDVEKYKQTGEVIPITEPEEYVPEPMAITEPDKWRNYSNPKKDESETESEEMARNNELKPTREQLIADRENGMTLMQLAKKYNCTSSGVSNWIKEYGLQTARKGKSDMPVKGEVESVDPAGPETAVVIMTDDEENLWRLIEENLGAIRRRKVEAADQEILERVNRMLVK